MANTKADMARTITETNDKIALGYLELEKKKAQFEDARNASNMELSQDRKEFVEERLMFQQEVELAKQKAALMEDELQTAKDLFAESKKQQMDEINEQKNEADIMLNRARNALRNADLTGYNELRIDELMKLEKKERLGQLEPVTAPIGTCSIKRTIFVFNQMFFRGP